MSLRDLARYAPLAKDALLAQRGDRHAAERLLRQGVPAVCDLLFGPGAGTIVTVGQELLEQQSPAKPEAIEGQYRVVGEAPDRACAGHYSAARERKVVAYLDGLPWGVVVILGRRGTGKTALACKLAERWHRRTYCLGIPRRVLPEGDWFEVDLEDGGLETVCNGSTLLIDDASNFFDSRRHASEENRGLAGLLKIARHRDLLVVANSQYSKGLERSLYDVNALILKPPGMLWRVMELEEFRPIYEPAAEFFEPLSLQEQQRHAWVLADVLDEPAVVHMAPPAWYGEKQSKNKAGRE